MGDKYEEITETCDKHTEATMTIKVVNVVGMTEQEAKDALSGLLVQIVYGTDTSMENGVVLAQNVAEGTELKRGESITITVNDIGSSNPEEPEEPEDPEENEIEDPNSTVDTNTTVDDQNAIVN